MARAKTPRWLQAARLRGQPGGEWLVRALGRGGVMPRVEAEAAVAAGRVRVDGREVREPFAPVGPASQLSVDGEPVTLRSQTRALMLHKPAGVVTAGRDPLAAGPDPLAAGASPGEGRGTVFAVLRALLPEALRGFEWLAIGRLDRDTTGLLLFTNAPELVDFVTAPATHLPKRYLARVEGKPGERALAALRSGPVLEDGPTRPAQARLRSPSEVELTLTEGRRHQVKRMLAAVGHPVLALHREAVGRLVLDVPVGSFRPLSEAELREGLGFDPALRPPGPPSSGPVGRTS